ncbi:MAG: TatD family hydrolase [Thermonemataceae bacterium]
MTDNTYPFVDTHAHIYLEPFQKDLSDTLERAFSEEVTQIIMPNIDHTTIEAMLAVEAKYSAHCLATMGLHPCSVKKDFERELYIVEEWLSKRSFTALGEMGTDLYWDQTFLAQQKEAFTIQAAWAKKYQLPLIIHCRDSIDLTIDLVETLKDENLNGVFHCFTGDAIQAERITKLGFFLGIGGIVTFKNAGLAQALTDIPLEHIILETDSPYLAPTPYRGKRNESSYIPLIAQKVADIYQIDVAKVREQTTKNALKLFGKAILSSNLTS